MAEQVGIDKGGIPDLAKAPSSLLEALEQHYTSMDDKGTRKGGRTTPAPASGKFSTGICDFKGFFGIGSTEWERALLYFLFVQRLLRGRSPVEWGEIPSVPLSVH